MKTKLFCCLCLLISKLPAMAVLTGTNAIDYQVVISTTNNGTGFSIINVVMPPRTFLIQHSGITGQVSSVSGTNSLKVNMQISADGANWTTVGTYIPARTNATVDTFAPNLSQLTLYMRAQAITTNTTTVGVTAVKP